MVKTLRNNLVALLIHLIINTIVYFAYGTPNSFPKYGFLGEFTMFLAVLLLYFSLGYLLIDNALKDQNTKIKNITSVSSIFVFGLCVWVYKFVADVWWVFGFFIYNYYAILLYPIFVHFGFDNLYILADLQLVFSSLPVFLIWAGLEVKLKKATNKANVKNQMKI